MEQKKNQWHPGFAAAIRMELKENRGDLTFEEEHPLNKKPLQMDMLVIKKDKNVEISNKIGKIFERYNIVEYKSPDDELGVDVLYKVLGYACLYKVSSEKENGYKADEITITLVRQRYPLTLVTYLEQRGCVVDQVSPGIYYVSGNIMFKIQILVTIDLNRKENIWLHSLRNNIEKEVYQELLTSVDMLEPREQEAYGEAILQVVTAANASKIEKWKGESAMLCKALEEIMAPELEKGMREATIRGRQEGKIKGKILAYADMGLTISQIADKVSLSVQEVEKILADAENME